MKLILTIILIIALQFVLPAIGAKPDLFLIAVVVVTLLAGVKKGVLLGFILGLIQDVASGTIYFNFFAKPIVAWITSLIQKNYEADGDSLSVISVIVLSVFFFIVEGIYLGKPQLIFPKLVFFTLYNMILTPLVYFCLTPCQHKICPPPLQSDWRGGKRG